MLHNPIMHADGRFAPAGDYHVKHTEENMSNK